MPIINRPKGLAKGDGMRKKTSYSALQIALHWSTALLIGANYLISEGMGEALDAHLEGAPLAGFTPTWHVWAGSVLLGLVLARIVVRFLTGAPEFPGAPTPADRAAALGHWVLYALMLAAPALGAATWFLQMDALGEIHVAVMNALMIVIAGHAGMAIFHHYVLKDGLLKKMVPVG
jgi:cytochrome b561